MRLGGKSCEGYNETSFLMWLEGPPQRGGDRYPATGPVGTQAPGAQPWKVSVRADAHILGRLLHPWLAGSELAGSRRPIVCSFSQNGSLLI